MEKYLEYCYLKLGTKYAEKVHDVHIVNDKVCYNNYLKKRFCQSFDRILSENDFYFIKVNGLNLYKIKKKNCYKKNIDK